MHKESCYDVAVSARNDREVDSICRFEVQVPQLLGSGGSVHGDESSRSHHFRDASFNDVGSRMLREYIRKNDLKRSKLCELGQTCPTARRSGSCFIETDNCESWSRFQRAVILVF